ncbi:uncharacterized protein RHO25_002858 [Cercospora beticola]|uniref:Uncharacterized protein n=1 Tax=Cercospora beticola TaxID=122368 RepID=A0ABZ0NFC7_CERBT|nr:hypothetical protein RHO25_002858 [Cercospora beticola]CAK1359472.1 unnamed protein product [Cercospora beticola]
MHFHIVTVLASLAVGSVVAAPIADTDTAILRVRDAEAAAITKIHDEAAEAHNAVILKAREEAAQNGRYYQAVPYYGGYVQTTAEKGETERTFLLLGLIPLGKTVEETSGVETIAGTQFGNYYYPTKKGRRDDAPSIA